MTRKKNLDHIPEIMLPRKGSPENLFRNKFMEKVSRSPFWVPVTMHSIIIISFLYLAFSNFSSTTVIPLFLAGVLVWTLTEYWVHRIVYHCETKWKWLLRLQFVAHTIHHQYPRDADRLAMPPIPAIILITAFFGLFWLIGGEFAVAFFPGFVTGYLLYISFHFAQHRFAPPKFKPLRELWRFHALHHYQYPDKAFGVSTRLWDFVFRTTPD
jgi:sterol desaturase/sphingolipid hydroxylase (fatty acid hydroxylase superfamily)